MKLTRSVALTVAVAFLCVVPAAQARQPLPQRLLLVQADVDDPPPREETNPATPPPRQPKPIVDDARPFHKQWWFWALAAVVVGGTVAIGVATYSSDKKLPHPCPADTVCFGDGRGR